MFPRCACSAHFILFKTMSTEQQSTENAAPVSPQFQGTSEMLLGLLEPSVVKTNDAGVIVSRTCLHCSKVWDECACPGLGGALDPTQS
jgi:hypothetical protein